MTADSEFRDSALGMIATISFPAIVGTADTMLKSASVRLVGYEKTGGGYCTAMIRGRITDVRLAIEAGAETAQEFGQLVSTLVIPRPYPNLDVVLPISRRITQYMQGGYSRLSNQAIGLLETKGFPALVGAADAMLKTADVHLSGYETIGAGLCTAIIRGNVADVTMAIEAGMYEAERIGEFHTLMIVPRPLDDLEDTLPTAACWIEEPQPVRMPLYIKDPIKTLTAEEATVLEPELIELPELQIPQREVLPNDREL
ncbi:MAG: carbon dioxide-concentrating mechanism protein [Pseudanabaenaceae cyanobacterium]|jgi:carbon dioxide concentrating mechanism protein CcmO